jgi:hypothetical protein
MSSTLLQRVYISSACYAFSEQQLRELLAECRINNLLNRISGILIYGNSTFFQVIEGSQESVDELWQKLQTDPRHTWVTQLLCRETSRLLFKDWSMAFERYDSTIASQMSGLADLFTDVGIRSEPLATELEIIKLIEAFSLQYQELAETFSV